LQFIDTVMCDRVNIRINADYKILTLILRRTKNI